jgi:GDP-4-dehydro-6-deoxy-D-mannose reductase
MRILITGATGFAGSHLVEALLAGGAEQILGISRHAELPESWRRDARIRLRSCDLADRAALETLLRDEQPEQIYHLAGYANTGRSFREPEAAWAGNLTATLNLYDAIVRWGDKIRVLFVGSGLIYGDPEDCDLAYDENCPLRPPNPYAASKAAADLASYQYTRSPGLDIVRARPFNHIGPRQSPQFAVANFARQVAVIMAGKQPPVLETGNLRPRRDLTDVRDMVRAYILLMAHGRSGEAYNIGAGNTYSMQEVVDRLIARAGVPIDVRPRADLVRSIETAAVRADSTKLRHETGWAPNYSLEQTLADTLAYWREHLCASQ